MTTLVIKESAIIPAHPQEVYSLMADYHAGHPSILPKSYFSNLRVLEGGFGEGTLIEVDTKALGAVKHYRMRVTEPEKGHILRETDVNTGTVTDFIFEPVPEGTRLIFDTTMYFRGGLAGTIEKLITKPIAYDMYRKELQNIVNHFAKQERLQTA